VQDCTRTHLVEDALAKIICDDAKPILSGVELLEKLLVAISVVGLRVNHVQHLLAVLGVDDALLAVEANEAPLVVRATAEEVDGRELQRHLATAALHVLKDLGFGLEVVDLLPHLLSLLLVLPNASLVLGNRLGADRQRERETEEEHRTMQLMSRSSFGNRQGADGNQG